MMFVDVDITKQGDWERVTQSLTGIVKQFRWEWGYEAVRSDGLPGPLRYGFALPGIVDLIKSARLSPALRRVCA